MRLFLSAATVLAFASPVLAQAPQPQVQPAAAAKTPDGSAFLLNARGVDIQVFADDVSTVTGRTLILDPAVTGKVTVLSQEPLDADGVWALFLSVLRVQGYAAFESNGVWRIIPQAAARSGAAEAGSRSSEDAAYVTGLIPLKRLAATDAAQSLKPFLGTTGSVEPFSRPNALIVSGYADDVRRIEALARQLDNAEKEMLASFPLENALAVDTIASIEKLIGKQGIGPRLAADVRSNQILARGSEAEIAEISELVAKLDLPGGTVNATRVFRLSHSDSETVVDILQGASSGSGSATNPVAIGLISDQGAAGSLPGSASPYGTGIDPVGAVNADSENSAAFGSSGGDLTLQAAPDINAVVARGSLSALADVERLIGELDVRRPQVMIEAAIVEITGDAAEQIGIQLGIDGAAPPGGAGAVSFSDQGLSLRRILSILGAPAASGILDDGLSAAISSGDEFGVLIQALGSSTQANLLSTPSITTLDNQSAEIVVGQNVPFRTGSFSTAGNTTNPFTTIERQDVGITLRVFPRIYEGDVVRLDVNQEVSSLVNAAVPGASDLITNRRSIQTTVLADDGNIVVLGGLITDDRTSGESKVPILGDIPLLGNLFKSKSKGTTRRTLFVFLRPTIIRDAEDMQTVSAERLDQLNETGGLLENRGSILYDSSKPVKTIGVDDLY